MSDHATHPGGISPDSLFGIQVHADVNDRGGFLVTIIGQDSQHTIFTCLVRADPGVDLNAIDVLGQQLSQIVSHALEQAAERSRS